MIIVIVFSEGEKCQIIQLGMHIITLIQSEHGEDLLKFTLLLCS